MEIFVFKCIANVWTETDLFRLISDIVFHLVRGSDSAKDYIKKSTKNRLHFLD